MLNLNLQFFGGRGSASRGGGSRAVSVSKASSAVDGWKPDGHYETNQVSFKVGKYTQTVGIKREQYSHISADGTREIMGKPRYTVASHDGVTGLDFNMDTYSSFSEAKKAAKAEIESYKNARVTEFGISRG